LGIGLAVGFGAGAYWKGRENGVGFGKGASVPAPEYFAEGASFSEVLTLKSDLKAQAMHRLAELEARYGPMHTGSVGEDWVTGEGDKVDRLIEELREATEEFAGTSHQSILLQHWLAVFRRVGRLDEWLDTYLDYAYPMPTDWVVGRLAPHAVRIGRELGREDEVVSALQRIAELPITFESKPLVQAALGRGSIERTDTAFKNGAGR